MLFIGFFFCRDCFINAFSPRLFLLQFQLSNRWDTVSPQLSSRTCSPSTIPARGNSPWTTSSSPPFRSSDSQVSLLDTSVVDSRAGNEMRENGTGNLISRTGTGNAGFPVYLLGTGIYQPTKRKPYQIKTGYRGSVLVILTECSPEQ